MTNPEFAKFAMALRTYYPKEKLLPNKEAMELWYDMLKDIPYEVIKTMLEKWVTENKWSPSISDIREAVANIRHGEIPDWGEGWKEVTHLIRKYGSYNERAALAEMNDLTRQVVKRLGYRNLCLSETPNVERANFRMVYEQLAERKKIDRQTSQEVKLAISGIREVEKLDNGTEFVKIGSLLGEEHGRN